MDTFLPEVVLQHLLADESQNIYTKIVMLNWKFSILLLFISKNLVLIVITDTFLKHELQQLMFQIIS